MSLHVLTFSQEEDLTRKFLELPGRLYPKKECIQQPAEEEKILSGTHVMSQNFSYFPMLVLDEQGSALCRAVLTVYPEDPEAFLGFFESEDNEDAARLLFRKAEQLALAQGCSRITGPVDASFWIRYRFKISHFESTYTGEPCNRDYYSRLWRAAGYEVAERYFSNHYRKVSRSCRNPAFSDRLRRKEQEGYRIESPSAASFDRTLNEVYDLLIELYRTFPAYKRISREEFTALYGYLRLLIRYPMVKMAYFEDRPVGFFISIPDYKTDVYGKLTLLTYARILRTRIRPQSYVMLYMGVDPAHRGLGKALAEAIRAELQKSGVPSVGALIRQGNINKDYFQELIDFEYEYVLLRKELS